MNEVLVIKYCLYCGRQLKVTPRYDIKKFCNLNCSHEYHNKMSVNLSLHRDTKKRLLGLKGAMGSYNDFFNELMDIYESGFK